METDLAERRRDPRYQRLMSATREAARGGYDAVSMRELAETTQMSLTTVYQFCSSKDHLIAEAHLEVMEELRAVAAKGRRGRTAEERVRQVFRGVAKTLEQDELLIRTLLRAMYSLDAYAAEVAWSDAANFGEMLDHALGDDEIPDRAAVMETLGRVFDSCIYGWLARGDDVAQFRKTMDQTVRLLLGERATPKSRNGRAPAASKSRSSARVR